MNAMNAELRKRTNYGNAGHVSDERTLDSNRHITQTSHSRRNKYCSVFGCTYVLKKLLLLLLTILIVIYMISPIVFRCSLTVRRMFIFMNYVNIPLFKNLSDPSGSFGLNCTRALHLDTDEGLRLGVWHILPQTRSDFCSEADVESAFNDERPIILYLHGNGGARGGEHRRRLYHILTYSDLDAHVVAFDYRGYGDSTNAWPTANGIANDAQFVYHWLLSQTHVNPKRVTVWGHSLGTAVSLKFVSQLQTSVIPNGIVLEAPFTSIKDAISHHPFGVLHRYMPLFEWFFIEPITQNELTNFDSVSLINQIQSPILILHAMDDRIVPFHMGRQLYEIALSRQNARRKAQFVAFNANYGYGHKDIYKDQELPKIIKNYITSTQD